MLLFFQKYCYKSIVNKSPPPFSLTIKRKAVSTSHFSQLNTAEYDMAMEWRVLQEKSDMWWKKLHEVFYNAQTSSVLTFIHMLQCVLVGAYLRDYLLLKACRAFYWTLAFHQIFSSLMVGIFSYFS